MMNRSRIIKVAGWLSIVSNLVLFGLKYWAGIITGSVALLADAWHTLSDSVSSAVVVVGIWIAGKPADDEHPFGHGRAEHIATIIIGVLLSIIGFEFLLKSVDRLQNHEAVEYGLIAKIVTVVSVIWKELLARYSFRVSNKTGSSVLRADAWHHRSDAFSSAIILAGIFLGHFFWWIDGVLGIVVAILIFYTAYDVVKNDISSLLGKRPDPKLIERIKEITVSSTGRDLLLHHFHIHEYGHHTELSFHIRLPSDMSLEEVHNICSQIEDAIDDELGFIVTIHPEPIR
jgi:cation diffusion facilitator family transporter